MTSESPSKTSSSHTNPHVVAIIQARLGSVRMPRKVLAPVLGQPLLWHLVARLRQCETIHGLVLAIPDSPANNALEVFARQHLIACSRGDEHDVLARFHGAAEGAGADIVVRITGDCPMVDPMLVDRLVRTLVAGDLDWTATGSTFPDGFDVEVCSMRALRDAMNAASASHDREHVMPYIRRSFSRNTVLEHTRDLSNVRLTLDEPADLTVIRAVFERFGNNAFSLTDVQRLLEAEPALFEANRELQRNEGAIRNGSICALSFPTRRTTCSAWAIAGAGPLSI